MKRFVLAISAMMIGLMATGCSGFGWFNGNPTGENTPIRIGVDPSLPPFTDRKIGTNEFSGFDIDLMQAIAEKSGLQFEFFDGGSNLVTLVAQCQLEAGISALPIMDSFRERVDFSEPYYTAGLVLVVKKGNITIPGKEQLAGMSVGVQTGSANEREIEKIPGVQPKKYQTIDQAFQNLTGGYIDAVLADAPRALSYASVKRNNLKIVGSEFGGMDYGMITCKERPDVLEQINAGLAKVKADGTLNRLAQRWGIYRGK